MLDQPASADGDSRAMQHYNAEEDAIIVSGKEENLSSKDTAATKLSGRTDKSVERRWFRTVQPRLERQQMEQQRKAQQRMAASKRRRN
jgi:hypothetical protein